MRLFKVGMCLVCMRLRVNDHVIWTIVFLEISESEARVEISGTMALHPEMTSNLNTCSSDVNEQYKDYFENEYVGNCMDGHYYLGNCTFPWVSYATIVYV